jgi:hypothetical protein
VASVITGKPKNQVEAKIDKMASSLRLKSTGVLKGTLKDWEGSWVLDSSATVTTEAGPVPTFAATFLEAAGKPIPGGFVVALRSRARRP